MHKRSCPSCLKELTYSDKYKLKRAISLNSLCLSCFAIQRAKDKNYINKLSNSIKKSWKEERKSLQSIKAKEYWKNLSLEEKTKIRKKMSENFNRSKERILKIKEFVKKLWNDPEYKNKILLSNLNPEVSNKRKNNLLKQLNDPNSKINSIESKTKRINSFKENWNSKTIEERSIILEKFLKTSHSFHSKSRSTSKLEIQVYNSIKHLGFKHKGVVAGYCVDIVHETLPIVIEVNGDFWHANPELYDANWFNNVSKMYAKDIWEKDLNRINKIINSGYKVIIIWENQIKRI